MVSEHQSSNEQFKFNFIMAEQIANTTQNSEITTPTTGATSNINLPPLIIINALKLTPTNYPSWRAQFNYLLLGYNLWGYLNGDTPCPEATKNQNGVITLNPLYSHWVQQDQLLFHAIFASLSEPLMHFIAFATTSREAWDKIARTYANRSRSRLMSLKEKLSNTTRGNKSVTEFLQEVKIIADQLARVGAPLGDDDITLHCLNGIGSEYKEIAGAIRAREQPISFEAFHDKLVEYEDFLHRESSRCDSSPITANFT